MKAIQGIMERSKLESIVHYLMDGTESNEKRMYDYDNTIENSCKDFFDKAEQIFRMLTGIMMNYFEQLQSWLSFMMTYF